MERACEICGKVFSFPLSHDKRRKTCSRECYLQRKRLKRPVITCPICGKRFSVPPWMAKKRKFCSKQCLGVSRKKRAVKVCVICGKKFEANWYRRGRMKYCSKKCLERSRRKVRNRPNKEQLEHLIHELTLDQIAKLYGVTSNAIRCWLKDVGLRPLTHKERNEIKYGEKRQDRKTKYG